MMIHGVVTASNVRSMAGNMWHIQTFGMYIMYILSQVEHKGRHQSLKRPLAPPVIDDDEDDEAFFNRVLPTTCKRRNFKTTTDHPAHADDFV